MKLTKYEHACVVLEEQGKKLIIDPGEFTPEFGDPTNVVAVVITHVHGDHFKVEHVQQVLAASPDAKVLTTAEVAEQLANPAVIAVKPGDRWAAGPFTLRFGGEQHALIHPSLPRPQNTSVFVNDMFFYPGDSYTLPEKPVELLAVPTNAPWMKVADSMDYIAKIKPKRCFPTHNGLLSENGNMVYNFGLRKACDDNGVSFVELKSGESTTI